MLNCTRTPSSSPGRLRIPSETAPGFENQLAFAPGSHFGEAQALFRTQIAFYASTAPLMTEARGTLQRRLTAKLAQIYVRIEFWRGTAPESAAAVGQRCSMHSRD